MGKGSSGDYGREAELIREQIHDTSWKDDTFTYTGSINTDVLKSVVKLYTRIERLGELNSDDKHQLAYIRAMLGDESGFKSSLDQDDQKAYNEYIRRSRRRRLKLQARTSGLSRISRLKVATSVSDDDWLPF